MQQDAVQVRPLRQITGESEFNELFFEGAFVPDENVVGDINGGWGVAITTLMNERAGLGLRRTVEIRTGLDELTMEARERGLLDDPYVLAGALGALGASGAQGGVTCPGRGAACNAAPHPGHAKDDSREGWR